MSEVHKINVQIADDSAVIRRLLTQILEAESDLSVVAAARNGLEAVELWKEFQPDVILMDVEMPIMDGIEAVAAIRTRNKHVPIIMFSSLTAVASEATLDALQNGATDFVTKPSRTGSVSDAVNLIRRELLPKIRVLGRRHVLEHRQSKPGSPPVSLVKPIPPTARESNDGLGLDSANQQTLGKAPEILVIGSSTGGPNALASIIERLPANFPIPIVIVQHMPPLFTALLAERLNRVSPLNIREATEGAELEPGNVSVAPGDFHVTVKSVGTSRQIHLDQGAPENSCRPAVDVLFRSAAKVYGNQTLAVVLTGMGKDGLVGSQAIRQAGGFIIAQDEATSTVWGMPRAVAAAGLAQRVLPLGDIPMCICQLIRKHSPVLARS